MPTELELPLFQVAPTSANVDWFVRFLQGRDWITAREVLEQLAWPVTENMKRKLRAWADASGGRIAGHQKGYKLVREMTRDEYAWWSNEMLKIARALESRVLESNKVFFPSHPEEI